MSNRRHLHGWFTRGPSRPTALLGLAMGLALGCSNESAPPGLDPGPNIDAGDQADGSGNVDAPTGSDGGDAVGMPSSPFKSLETAANAPAIFSQSRAGVPLPGGAVAFIASLETLSDEERAASGARIGIWLQADKMSAPTVLYAGDKIVNPFDIDASFDGKTLYVADVAGGAEGRGAILSLSTGGGEPTELVSGFGPRGITVASDDRIYFTGIDEETGDAGLFLLAANSASKVFAGAPFVDPSGIAVRKDGSVLVADTRLSDGTSSAATALSKEAGIVLVKDGQASIFATGFSTGYPAGIALTTDEKALIISGQGPERSDTVYIVDVANPAAPPTVVTDKFSAYQDSSAGLKRAHDSNTFIWASLAANGGTVYRIVAN